MHPDMATRIAPAEAASTAEGYRHRLGTHREGDGAADGSAALKWDVNPVDKTVIANATPTAGLCDADKGGSEFPRLGPTSWLGPNRTP